MFSYQRAQKRDQITYLTIRPNLQRSCCAQDALPWLEREAKERQRQNAIAHNTGKPNVEKVPPSDSGKSRDHAAAQFGVNARYVSDAKASQADPNTARAVFQILNSFRFWPAGHPSKPPAPPRHRAVAERFDHAEGQHSGPAAGRALRPAKRFLRAA
jgi:hypothetical protein